MRFLVESHSHFNHMTATLVQGLQQLGHICYGLNENWNNYLVPHEGQETDAFIQTTDNYRSEPHHKINILLIGADSGHGENAHTFGPKAFRDFQAVFVRDLRHSLADHIFPINFGIEDRYYCITNDRRKLLSDRNYDVTFLGGFDYNPDRKVYVEMIKAEFKHLNLKLEGKNYNEPDGYWSKWLNAHCTHSRKYFEILADSKIVLSPWGLGPDCARHWEALASGGVPLIQRMPVTMCPPGLRDSVDSVLFHHTHDLRHLIYNIVEHLDHYQKIADAAWKEGKKHHTTKARAAYFIEMLGKVIEDETFSNSLQQHSQSK